MGAVYYLIVARLPALSVSLYVAGKRCVIVGEGELADERARRLRDAGAEPLVVAPADFADLGPEACAGAWLVMALDDATTEAVRAAARAAGALFYAHDKPRISDLAMPALARRGPIQIAVSTDGESPTLAGELRAELQRALDRQSDNLDAILEHLRLKLH
jgi:precorrin-2 dehydrogenase/sirohydrochlorin ferrochelatase